MINIANLAEKLIEQNRTLIRLASVFTGLIIVVTVVFVLIMLTSKTGTLTIPDVTNKSVKDAIKILQDAGFIIEDGEEGISSKDIEVGNVVKTNPYAGTKKKKGTADTKIKKTQKIQKDIGR